MKYLKPTFRLVIALSLSYAWVIVGFEVGDSLRYRADQDLLIAKYNELTARHEAVKAIYNNDKLNLVVDVANSRAKSAEMRLQRVCSRLKGKC
jgi:hypothetical protein